VREVATLDDFCGLLRGLEPSSVSEEQAAVLARIAGQLLQVGRVVTPDELYKFLEDEFAVKLSTQPPRIEQAHLRFLAVKADLVAGVTELRSVDVDINSSRASVIAAPRK
jgi:hypothetical protein